MKWRAALLGSVVATICAGPALACEHTTEDYCGPELVAMIYTTASGDVYIEPSSSWTGVVCSPVSGKYAILDPTTSNFNQLYAMLLAAKLSGSAVQMVMNGSDTTCTISYVTLS